VPVYISMYVSILPLLPACCNLEKIAQAGCVLIMSWFLVPLLAILCNKVFNTAMTL
jgi:hypothetical protein